MFTITPCRPPARGPVALTVCFPRCRRRHGDPDGRVHGRHEAGGRVPGRGEHVLWLHAEARNHRVQGRHARRHQVGPQEE